MLGNYFRRRQLRTNDKGITLIEVVVGVVLAAMISVFIVRISVDLSNSMQNNFDSLKATTGAMRFTQLIRYDVASSADLFVYGAPTNYTTSQGVPSETANSLCSSWRTDSIVNSWSTTTQRRFVRTLISIRIKDLAYDPENVTGWVEPTSSWVGYEIRRDFPDPKVKKQSYWLWRVTCGTESNGRPTSAVTSSEKLVDLGPEIGEDVGGFSQIKCWNKSGTATITCPLSGLTASLGSTFAQSNYYSFEIPYKIGGKNTNARLHAGLKELSDLAEDKSLQKMFRRASY